MILGVLSLRQSGTGCSARRRRFPAVQLTASTYARAASHAISGKHQNARPDHEIQPLLNLVRMTLQNVRFISRTMKTIRMQATRVSTA